MGVVGLAVGLVALSWGLSAGWICSDPGGCRVEPYWPAVVIGLITLLIGGSVIFRVPRHSK